MALSIVGLSSPTAIPFDPRTITGARLVEWSGCASYEELCSLARLENVMPRGVGVGAAHVGRFTLKDSRERWGRGFEIDPSRYYVWVGVDVIRILGTRAYPTRVWGLPRSLEWYDSSSGARCALLPHPSGRNIQLNSPEFRERCRQFLTVAVDAERTVGR